MQRSSDIDPQNLCAAPGWDGTDCDEDHCMNCGKELSYEDKGLHRKLINRGSVRFLCKACLAEKFRMSIADCDELIRHFKEDGCTLFL